MTMCLTSLGDGIASGMQMLAMALSGQPQNNVPQVSHPHFNTYSALHPHLHMATTIIVPH